MTLSREDQIDLLLLTIALGSIIALAKLTRDLCRPLPFRRRLVVQAKRALHL